MTAATVAAIATVLAVGVSAPAWSPRIRPAVASALAVAATLLALVAAGAAVAAASTVDGRVDAWAAQATVVVAAVAGAVVAGGPVTELVLRLADRGTAAEGDATPGHGELLRGGAWIGALERGAVCVSLLLGAPEGLAFVLAVKGLGRYPELRAGAGGTAERFIVGTFTSVLWAAGAAGTATLLLA